MAISPEELERMALSPKQTANDSGSQTMRDADDAKKWLEMANAQEVVKNQKPALRMFKLVPPGSV